MLGSNATCLDITKFFNHLDNKNQKKSMVMLEKAAHAFEADPTMTRFGWNKDGREFLNRFIAATGKDPFLFALDTKDIKKFKIYMKKHAAGLLKGWGGWTTDWKVLKDKVKWMPGGTDLAQEIEGILGYQRRHQVVNEAQMSRMKKSIRDLSKAFGVDLGKLKELEVAYQTETDPTRRGKIENEINEYLTTISGKLGENPAAGDLFKGLRDVMEGTRPEDLMKTIEGKRVPWDGGEIALAREVQNSWYMVRKDMLKVAINGLNTEIELARRIDKQENGIRGLEMYLKSLKAKIIELETSSKKTSKARPYDFTGNEKFNMGLETEAGITMRRDLGYMPHHILYVQQHLHEFNNYMLKDHSNLQQSAEQTFKDVVGFYAKSSKFGIDRLKARTDSQVGYYSKNPLFFVQKYIADVTKFNYDSQMKNTLTKTMQKLMKAKDTAKGGGSYDTEVIEIVDSAINVLTQLASDTRIGGNRPGESSSTTSPNGNFMQKAVRMLTAYTFARTMGFGIRSGTRNYIGGRLVSYIEHGAGMWKAEMAYVDANSEVKVGMNNQLENYGLLWQRGGMIDHFISEYGKAAATRGTHEEGMLPPGLTEVKLENGQTRIVIANQSKFDKALDFVEKYATASGVVHKNVENWLRPGVFKAVYATVHQNMMQNPDYWFERNMRVRKKDMSEEEWFLRKNKYVEIQSGKEAYAHVTATQFEYGKVSKADILKSKTGQVVGQYQHYRFSLASYMKHVWDHGSTSIRAGDMTSMEARRLYRLGVTYPLIELASWYTGIGFAKLATNDVYEFMKNNYTMIMADPKTPEGQKAIEQASFGTGLSSNLGPNIGLMMELGKLTGLMNDSPTNKFMQATFLEGTPKTETEYHRKMRLARLFNIEIARFGGQVGPSLLRMQIPKAFYQQFGLFQEYDAYKSGKKFRNKTLKPVRGFLGVTEPGGARKHRKLKQSRNEDEIRQSALESIASNF